MIAVDFFHRLPDCLQGRPRIVLTISSALAAIAAFGALSIALKCSRIGAAYPLLASGILSHFVSTPARLCATAGISLLAFWGFFRFVRISPLPEGFSSLPRKTQDWCVKGVVSLDDLIKRCQFALNRESLSKDFIAEASKLGDNWEEKWRKLPPDVRLWCYEGQWDWMAIFFTWLALPESICQHCMQSEMGEARVLDIAKSLAFCNVPKDFQDYFRHFPSALQLWDKVPQEMKQQCHLQTSGPAKIAYLALIMLSIPNDAEYLPGWCRSACRILNADWENLEEWEKKWCSEGKSLEIRLNRYLTCLPSELSSLIFDQRKIPLSSWEALSEECRDYFFEGDQIARLLAAQEFFHLPKSIQTWRLEEGDAEERFLFAIEIAHCSKEKRRELICPDGLSSLPDLRDFKHIKKVVLNQPSFSIFEEIGKLGAIRELEIYSLKAPSLKGMEVLQNLEVFYLEDCEMESLDGIETLARLRTLDLINIQGIRTLPSLDALKSLQNFTLIEVSIDQLPNLSGLENLNTLVIAHTSISDLPGGNKLKNLEKLILKDTEMVALPESISSRPHLRCVKLGKEFGSSIFFGRKLMIVPNDEEDTDLYICPETQVMEVSMEGIAKLPDRILDRWVLSTPRPSIICFLDKKGNPSLGKGIGVNSQFYAALAQHLFQKGQVFSEFYERLPSARNLKLPSSKWSLSRVGAFLSYLYRWRFLTGKILPETFFGILQILKKQKNIEAALSAEKNSSGKGKEEAPSSKETLLKIHGEALDLLLKGEENRSLRELKAHLEGEPVNEEFLKAYLEISDEEAVLSLYAFLERYSDCLEIAKQILKGISGPLERDLTLYPFYEVSSRLQGFVSAEECIAAFRRNSSDKQVNQKIDWLEELLRLKEKVGDPVFVEDFISYATGGRSLDEGDIITIGESFDECSRVTTCAKILSLSKTVQSKEKFWELMEALVKDREFSAV